MAYTLLLKEDNTIIASHKETIVQRSTMVDVLQVIAPRYREWKDGMVHDMTEFDLVLGYVTPISKTVRLVTMPIKDAEYKTNYILYTLDITTDITAECGIVKLYFSYMDNYITDEDVSVPQVDNYLSYDLHVIPLETFLTVPDDAVGQLAQLYLANKNQIEALNQLAAILNQTKIDDIKLDVIDGQIYGTANGNKTGTGFSVEELGNEIAERTTQGTVKIQNG